MRVRMYNRTTFEAYFYTVSDLDLTTMEITLTLEDGAKLTFDRKHWISFILT